MSKIHQLHYFSLTPDIRELANRTAPVVCFVGVTVLLTVVILTVYTWQFKFFASTWTEQIKYVKISAF